MSLEERPKGLTSKEKLRRSVDDLKKELTVLEKTVLTENRDKPREVQRVDEEKGQSYQMIRQFIEQEIVSKYGQCSVQVHFLGWHFLTVKH